MSSWDFANYIFSQVKNLDSEKTETKIRVFQLLYLTYGTSLKVRGEPLFEEDFCALTRGPVAVDADGAWNFAQGKGENNAKELCPRDKEFCDCVLSQFQGKTVSELEEMCRHAPWRNAYDEEKVKIADENTSDQLKEIPCLKENEIEEAFEEIPDSKVQELLKARRAEAFKFHEAFKEQHPHIFCIEDSEDP